MEQKIDIFECLEFIRANSVKFGLLKGRVTYLTELRKTIKAQIMSQSLSKAVNMKEIDAYSNPKYIAHLEELNDAIADYEALRMQMVYRELQAEAWRSLEASNRMIDKVAR